MGGEWLAWVDVANGDAAWEAMAGAFLEGAIPHCTSARIGISEAKNMYVICVTTADYTDLAVRPTLRACISKLSAVKPNACWGHRMSRRRTTSFTRWACWQRRSRATG